MGLFTPGESPTVSNVQTLHSVPGEGCLPPQPFPHLPQGDSSLQSPGEGCHLLSRQSCLYGHPPHHASEVPKQASRQHTMAQFSRGKFQSVQDSAGHLNWNFSQAVSISCTVFIFGHISLDGRTLAFCLMQSCLLSWFKPSCVPPEGGIILRTTPRMVLYSTCS